jgi:hypothetical protein
MAGGNVQEKAAERFFDCVAARPENRDAEDECRHSAQNDGRAFLAMR